MNKPFRELVLSSWFEEYSNKYGEPLALAWLGRIKEDNEEKLKEFNWKKQERINKQLQQGNDFIFPSKEYIIEYTKNLKEDYRNYCTTEYLNEEEERIDMYEKKY